MSTDYRACLAAYHVEERMSRVGNCYNNVSTESFFATLKVVCTSRPFITRSKARTAIFEYIEGW